MAEDVVVILLAVGIPMFVSGVIIQFTNRSPFSNTPMDEKTRQRLRVSTWMMLVANVCLVAIQLVLKLWR